MIYLDLAGVLAVAARVARYDPAKATELADLEAIETTLAEVRSAGGDHDVAVAAATLLTGLLRRRLLLFGPRRRIALAATLQFLALNGWDLELEPGTTTDRLLDRAAFRASPAEVAEELRGRLRPLDDSPLDTGTLDTGTLDTGTLDTGTLGSHPSRRGRPASPYEAPGTGDVMFERFTDRARRAVTLAQEESRGLHHGYIGTEHVLLGLLSEGDGIAAKALDSCGITRSAVRTEVTQIVGEGTTPSPSHIPFTPRAKEVLQLALREAIHLGHNYIGTEHLLLGLVREGEGVAAQVLVKLGADLPRVRQRVLDLVAESGKTSEALESLVSGDAETGRDEVRLLRRLLDSLLDDKERLRAELSRVRADNERLTAEVDRLRERLREHGIDADG